MSKMIVKNAVTELGGQFVVLKRQKLTKDGKPGLQSVYSVLDSDTLKKVGEFLDKTALREFIEDHEWNQRAAEREAKKAAGPASSQVSVVVEEDDGDDLDPEPEPEVASGIQQPPV